MATADINGFDAARILLHSWGHLAIALILSISDREWCVEHRLLFLKPFSIH